MLILHILPYIRLSDDRIHETGLKMESNDRQLPHSHPFPYLPHSPDIWWVCVCVLITAFTLMVVLLLADRHYSRDKFFENAGKLTRVAHFHHFAGKNTTYMVICCVREVENWYQR